MVNLNHYHKTQIHFPLLKLPKLLEREIRFASAKKRKRVLDIGCGDGMLISMLINKGIIGKKEIVGIDTSEQRLSVARNILPGVTLKNEDALKLTFKSGEFDFVYALMVIEHVTSDQQFANEISRVLKKSGGFVVSTVLKKKWAVYFYRHHGEFVCDPTHLREYKNPSQLVRIFKEAGFGKVKYEIEQLKFSLFELIFRVIISAKIISPDQARRVFQNSLAIKLRPLLYVPIPGYYRIWVYGNK